MLVLNAFPAISEDFNLKIFQGRISPDPRGGGGHFRNFWVGMCRWDPGALNLYQS